jgi:hypothetical protein
MYRGAINQVINARADHRGQVTREAAEKASHLSRRSDAAFALTVLVLSIIAFALVRTFTLPVQLLVRILIILAIAAVEDENAKKALDALPLLAGLDAHSSVILSQIDEGVFKKLGVNQTCEARYERKKFYHK